MADIALLVAEDFGKRPRSRRNFGAVMKVCSSWAEAAAVAAAGVKVNVVLLKAGVEEPNRSNGLALAAFDGFFSA